MCKINKETVKTVKLDTEARELVPQGFQVLAAKALPSPKRCCCSTSQYQNLPDINFILLSHSLCLP